MEIYGSLLYNYTSLTVLAASVCLLGFFSGMRIGKKAGRVVALLSPTALSVYLIHAHPIVWNRLFGGLFAPLAQLPAPLCAIAVLGCAVGVVTVCSAFDLLRELLFRLLRLKERIGSPEERIMK